MPGAGHLRLLKSLPIARFMCSCVVGLIGMISGRSASCQGPGAGKRRGANLTAFILLGIAVNATIVNILVNLKFNWRIRTD